VDHHYSHFSVTLNAINCFYKGGDITLKGPVDYKWIKLNQLSDFAFPKASIKLFDSIKKLKLNPQKTLKDFFHEKPKTNLKDIEDILGKKIRKK